MSRFSAPTGPRAACPGAANRTRNGPTFLNWIGSFRQRGHHLLSPRGRHVPLHSLEMTFYCSGIGAGASGISSVCRHPLKFHNATNTGEEVTARPSVTRRLTLGKGVKCLPASRGFSLRWPQSQVRSARLLLWRRPRPRRRRRRRAQLHFSMAQRTTKKSFARREWTTDSTQRTLGDGSQCRTSAALAYGSTNTAARPAGRTASRLIPTYYCPPTCSSQNLPGYPAMHRPADDPGQ